MNLFDHETFDLAVALGHLHPLILHLPIGIFAGLAFLLLVGGRKEQPGLRRAHGALVLLLVLTTPLAAVTGWLLAEAGSYGEPVDLHRWLGIGTGAVTLLLALAFVLRAKLYAPLVWLGLLLLFPTGHLGAVLTHGERFLLDPWFGPEEAEGTDVVAGQPPTFAEVQPVLDRLCGRCHGEQRQRGGLALHTLALAEEGGDTGPALLFGDPAGSLLLQRVSLPLEDGSHMPPAEKPQPTAQEIELLRAWIAGETVSFAVPEQESEPGPEPEPDRGASRAVIADPVEAERAVATLRERLVHVQPVAEDSEELWIDCASATLTAGELEGLLEPLAHRIVELSLARQSVGGADLEFVGSLPRLERLDLRALPGGPYTLAGLGGAVELRALNLAGTSVDPAAVELLGALPRLERVHVWGTGLDAEALQLARRELEVHAASRAPDEPVEVEGEVVFTRVGEEPPDPAVVAATPRPLNTTCPVTGAPVDARYVVLYEGHAIAFCCPNCPKAFWEDPGPFLAGLGLAAESEGD